MSDLFENTGVELRDDETESLQFLKILIETKTQAGWEDFQTAQRCLAFLQRRIEKLRESRDQAVERADRAAERLEELKTEGESDESDDE